MTSKIFCETRLANTRTRDWNFATGNFFAEFSGGIDFPTSLKVFHSTGGTFRISVIQFLENHSNEPSIDSMDLELLLLLLFLLREKGANICSHDVATNWINALTFCFLYFYKGNSMLNV